MASHRVVVQCIVEVEINNPDVLARVTGPGGDEWRSQAYKLRTEPEVLVHLATNAVVNGVDRVNRLDGWADLDDGAATMKVVDADAEVLT